MARRPSDLREYINRERDERTSYRESDKIVYWLMTTEQERGRTSIIEEMKPLTLQELLFIARRITTLSPLGKIIIGGGDLSNLNPTVLEKIVTYLLSNKIKVEIVSSASTLIHMKAESWNSHLLTFRVKIRKIEDLENLSMLESDYRCDGMGSPLIMVNEDNIDNISKLIRQAVARYSNTAISVDFESGFKPTKEQSAQIVDMASRSNRSLFGRGMVVDTVLTNDHLCNDSEKYTILPNGDVLACAHLVREPDYSQYVVGNAIETPFTVLSGLIKERSDKCQFDSTPEPMPDSRERPDNRIESIRGEIPVPEHMREEILRQARNVQTAQSVNTINSLNHSFADWAQGVDRAASTAQDFTQYYAHERVNSNPAVATPSTYTMPVARTEPNANGDAFGMGTVANSEEPPY